MSSNDLTGRERRGFIMWLTGLSGADKTAPSQLVFRDKRHGVRPNGWMGTSSELLLIWSWPMAGAIGTSTYNARITISLDKSGLLCPAEPLPGYAFGEAEEMARRDGWPGNDTPPVSRRPISNPQLQGLPR